MIGFILFMENTIGQDQREVKKQQDAEAEYQRLHKRRILDIAKLLKQPEFRRFIWHILSEAGIFRASFTNNSLNTAFLEGKRDLGLALLSDIDTANINAIFQIRQEFVSELKSKEAANKNQEGKNE